MIEKTDYRLGSFKTTEYEGGLLQWEMHTGLGEQKSGPCYLRGEVLIIGKSTHQGAGFLILEFDERLRKFPLWDKTSYYCYEADILSVEPADRHETEYTGHLPLGDFRLGNYLISIQQDGFIFWSISRGRKSVASGQARILGDILFLDGQTMEEYQDRTKFLQRLEPLPAWNATSSWCSHPARRVHKVSLEENRPYLRRSPVDAVQSLIKETPNPVILAHRDTGLSGVVQHREKKKREPRQVLHEKRSTAQKTFKKVGNKVSGVRDRVSCGFSNLKSKTDSGFKVASERRLKKSFPFGKLLIASFLAMLLAILISFGFFLNEHRESADRHHDSHERERRHDH